MRKQVTTFTEFKRIINRTYLKGYDICYTWYGFYYRTRKCDFFYPCRSAVERSYVFDFLRNCQIKYYELESFV